MSGELTGLTSAEVRDRIERAWAMDLGQGETAEALIDLADHWVRPEFPIGGADLKAMGLGPSPRMGRVLAQLEAWWVAHDFPETGLEEQLAALVSENDRA